VARKGGEETLDQRIPKDKLERVENPFERWGFGTVLVAAILPPPFPTVPFLAGAGTLNYPVRKFIAALTLARAARFTIASYLALVYGRSVVRLISKVHLGPTIIVAVLAGGGTAAFLEGPDRMWPESLDLVHKAPGRNYKKA
jgi:membrane protein DedA with SNARE-associated domain